MIRLEPGPRRGTMRVPVSKSHAHRVLVAEFLAGRTAFLAPRADDCEDVLATKRCLLALAARSGVLDCGESGTTRRLLGPVAAAIGIAAEWKMEGRLASRPQIEYGASLAAGVHELPGDVSSQFASGLLFALPLLEGDSEIAFSTPLKSRGYVDMTLAVLGDYGVEAEETPRGFRVRGGQRYVAPEGPPRIEGDWSSAAFILAMAALGSEVGVSGGCAELRGDSLQPDRSAKDMLQALSAGGDMSLDVDERPDLFPVLSVVAAAGKGRVRFTGTRRLRLKESDRVAAMGDVLGRFGARSFAGDGFFDVFGTGGSFRGGSFKSFSDHRVAMSVAVGATRAESPVEIDDATCAAKSFPTFFEDFERLGTSGGIERKAI